jgi:uncharacterized protein YecE (DUF72 family)
MTFAGKSACSVCDDASTMLLAPTCRRSFGWSGQNRLAPPSLYLSRLPKVSGQGEISRILGCGESRLGDAPPKGKIHAGTSGWAYPAWKPAFYPAKLAPAKFLTYYASRLNSVEVNFTFRRFPAEKLLRGWIEATPSEFEFAIKAHQKITHVLRLRGAAEFTADFAGSLQPLADAGKLGPVLFQLPPFLKCDVGLLQEFLGGWPRNVRATFEFRHPSWFCEETFAALRQANVALCLAESEKLETPDVQTADFLYLRLRKPSYSKLALQRRVEALRKHGELYVYLKHEETPEGALLAESLLQS